MSVAARITTSQGHELRRAILRTICWELIQSLPSLISGRICEVPSRMVSVAVNAAPRHIGILA